MPRLAIQSQGASVAGQDIKSALLPYLTYV